MTAFACGIRKVTLVWGLESETASGRFGDFEFGAKGS